MATVRYTVDGIPPQYADAFFPMPPLTPAGFSSVRRFIAGSPGTTRVPSPAPRGRGTLSSNPEWKPPSSVAPDWFTPQLWVNDIRELRPAGASGVPVRYMPIGQAKVPPRVPSLTDVAPSASVAMRGRKIGGLRSMFWPRTIPRWPNLAGEYPT